MKSTRFQAVICMVLGLVLAAMTGTARADSCDDHEETYKEKSKMEYNNTDHPGNQGLSRDQEQSPYRIQEARESADAPITEKSIRISEELNTPPR